MGLIQDSPEHKAIRETVAGIASRYGAPYFIERGRSGGSVDELWKDLGAAGLLGLHLPEEYGGGGGGMAEAVIVVEELAAHGMPLLVWVISPAICGNILAHHASEEMKQRWLPVIADGTKIMAFGLTEPDAGSNSHNVKTAARRTETGWTISGSKYYISAVDQSDAILVVARDAEHSTPEKSALSLLVVPTNSPGLSFQEIDTSIVSTDRQFTVYFDNVELGHDALIGVAGDGLRQVFAGLNPERILVGALCGGIGRYAIGKAADYAKQQFEGLMRECGLATDWRNGEGNPAQVVGALAGEQPVTEQTPLYSLWKLQLSQVAPVLPYLLLVLMLIFRPKGLLGTRAD